MALRLPIGGSRQWVAVEVDRRRVRAVGFRPNRGRCKFDVIGSSAHAEPIDTTDAAAVGEAVAKVLAELRLSGARAVMNVRRDEVILRPLSLPAGTPDTELASMVRFQVAKELSFAADQAVIDHLVADHYQAVDGAAGPDGRTVLAAAVRTEVVEFYRQVALAAGVRLMRLGLRPQSIGRCVGRCVRHSAGECVAVVNVTADETEIDLLIDGSLAFSRSVPIGMPDRAVWPDQRKPVVDAAVREVMLSVQSFQAVRPGGKVDAVLVCGDTGLEDDLIAALSTKVSTMCELFRPARALGLPTRSDGSAYAGLLGAAMDGSTAATYDFLNPKRPAVQRDPRRDRIAAAGIAVMALAAVLIGGGSWYLSNLAAESDRIARNLRNAEDADKKISKLTGRVRSIEQWADDSVDWLGHWARISAAFPPATDAYIRNFTIRADGAILFTVRAKTRETIEQVQKQLGSLNGYRVNPVRVLPVGGGDLLSLGYAYESAIEVRADRSVPVELSGELPRRPDDDASASLLSQRLRSGRGRRGRGARP